MPQQARGLQYWHGISVAFTRVRPPGASEGKRNETVANRHIQPRSSVGPADGWTWDEAAPPADPAPDGWTWDEAAVSVELAPEGWTWDEAVAAPANG